VVAIWVVVKFMVDLTEGFSVIIRFCAHLQQAVLGLFTSVIGFELHAINSEKIGLICEV